MRRAAIAFVLVALSAPLAFAQPPPPAAKAPDPNAAFAEGMRAYHAALAARRLGSREAMSLDDVLARLARSDEPRRRPRAARGGGRAGADGASRRGDRAAHRARRAPGVRAVRGE